MNLQENYRRLFKGKPAGNDGSILFEARYNVKVKKHQELKSYDDDLEKLRVHYEGTISGPDIPNGTEFTAEGVAGEIPNLWSLSPSGDIVTLQVYVMFPNSETSTDEELVSISNPKELYNTPAVDLLRQIGVYAPFGRNWDAHLKMTKEKKDELFPFINDAVVKYALSKGLEDAVAEKSGGTFNLKAALDAKKKKKKTTKRTGPEIAVFDGEVDGRNRTASGTYGDEELEWELDTDDGITSIRVDGKSIEDDDPMYDAILTAVEDEGYEIDLDEGIMNLQENYKRLFKGRIGKSVGWLNPSRVPKKYT